MADLLSSLQRNLSGNKGSLKKTNKNPTKTQQQQQKKQ